MLVVAVWGFVEAFRDQGPVRATVRATTRVPAATLSTTEVESWFDRALRALAHRDEGAWRAALPAKGSAARQALAALYRRLAPIPWTGLHTLVVAIPGIAGRFDIKILGRPGGAGPPTRLVAERLLDLTRRGGRVVAVGDHTPAGVAREYLMAFATPRAVIAPGVVAISDQTWQPLARELAADMPQARADVAATLGVTGDRPIVVFVYSSAREVADYLGNPETQKRARFFSRLASATSPKPWWPSDVGVLGPELPPADPWTVHMLAHEVTHTLTLRWFFHTAHAPPLLLEGMATAVEASRSYLPLQREVAAGNTSMPLLGAFATNDLWSGAKPKRIELGYLEGGSFVKYILSRWGKTAVRRVSVDIADSDLSDAAIKRVIGRDLGLGWTSFYSGWEAYVATLP